MGRGRGGLSCTIQASDYDPCRPNGIARRLESLSAVRTLASSIHSGCGARGGTGLAPANSGTCFRSPASASQYPWFFEHRGLRVREGVEVGANSGDHVGGEFLGVARIARVVARGSARHAPVCAAKLIALEAVDQPADAHGVSLVLGDRGVTLDAPDEAAIFAHVERRTTVRHEHDLS